MTNELLLEELSGAISAHRPLGQVIATLREYRMQGVSRGEVQSALERLRESAPDEATEDRILEVLDIVSGFCPPEKTVWDD